MRDGHDLFYKTTMTPEIIQEILSQWPIFAILVPIIYAFYKFMDRVYDDHIKQVNTLTVVFKDTISKVTENIGERLDNIEDTLVDIKNK